MPVASAARGQRSNRNGVALKCQCSPPKTIRVAESNVAYATARCEVCGQPFTGESHLAVKAGNL